MAYAWRVPFDSAEVDALHAEGFGHPLLGDDWRWQAERHSLGWVGARDEDGELAPFYFDACGFTSVPAGVIPLR